MEIYCVRHTSVAVEKNVVYGQTDVSLKDSFPEEAAQVAIKLQEIKFDKVFCSPLSRCRKLAAWLDLDPLLDDRLKELNFGEWEMKKWDDIHDPNLSDWFDDWINTPTTGGESFSQLYERCVEFLTELKQLKEADPERWDKSNILIITHGGIIAAALVYANVLTPDQAFSSPIAYGSVVRISI